jgi:hypothetical protein
VLGLVLGAPAGSVAEIRLHADSTPYVHLLRLSSGQLTARLTARGRRLLGRRLRGNVLDGSCTTLGSAVQGSTFSSSSSTDSAGLDRRGHAHFQFVLDPHADFCDFSLSKLTVRRKGVSVTPLLGPPIDAIALTAKGARYLDADRVTVHMFVVIQAALALAHTEPAGHFPPASTITRAFANHRLSSYVVALSDPNASPAGTAIGFFSDAANHAEAVGITADHQRLFIDSANGVLSSNCAEHIDRYISGQVAVTASR